MAEFAVIPKTECPTCPVVWSLELYKHIETL